MAVLVLNDNEKCIKRYKIGDLNDELMKNNAHALRPIVSYTLKDADIPTKHSHINKIEHLHKIFCRHSIRKHFRHVRYRNWVAREPLPTPIHMQMIYIIMQDECLRISLSLCGS